MDEYTTHLINKQDGGCKNKKDIRILESNWNYDMEKCPLDTKVYLLSGDDFPILPQKVFIGTITYNGSFKTRGECYQGNPDYFYRSTIIAWKPYYEI